MDQVDSGNRSAAPSGARPSLFASGKSPTPDGPKQPEAISILSSLDKNGGKKPLGSNTGLPTWFTIAVGSLLGITIGAAIVISFTRDANITRHAPVVPMVVTRAAPQSLELPATTAPTPAVTTLATEIQAAATIESAPPAASVPATAVVASPPPAAAEAGKKIGATTSEPAAAAMSEPAGAAKAAAAPAPAATTADPVPSAKASVNASAETRAERTSSGKKAKTRDSKPEVATAPAAPADRDASLLAALVAYGEGRPAADINARAAPITNKSTDPKAAGGTTTLAQAGGQFDPKHDVVLREPTVSTAELVRRCKTLGFFEGLLCRMRVCSNLWGKDAACPQSSAPVERGTQ
jgi:hypothetical protein